MTFLLALIAILIVVVGAHVVARRDGYFSPPVLLAVSIIFYGIALPLEFAIVGEGAIWVRSGPIPIPAPVSTWIAFLSVVALMAVFLGYLLARGTQTLGIVVTESAQRRISKVLLAVSATCVLLLVFNFRNYLLGSADYQTASLNFQISPLYGLLVRTAYQSYAMAIVARYGFGRARIRSLLLMASPMLLWGVYSNDKDPMVVAGLALGVSMLGRAQGVRRPLIFTVGLLVSLVGLALSTVVFSVYRGLGSVWVPGWIERTGGLLNRVEPAGPFFSLVQELAHPRSPEYGLTVVEGLIMWIPRFVWPDRPLDLAQQFAQTTISGWRPGQGYGYSMLAEGLVNGGVLGVAGVFGLLGALMGGVWRWTGSMHGRDLGILVYAWRGVVVLYICFVSMRGPVSLVITNIVQSIPMIIAASLVLAWPRRSSDSPGPTRAAQSSPPRSKRTESWNRPMPKVTK